MTFVNRRRFLAQASSMAMLPFFRERAELILHNGNVLTINEMQPKAQAVAITGDHIQAVGTNDEILGLKSPITKMVDLGGRTVVPGFIDAHSHPGSSGRRHLTDIDCELPSIRAIQDAVAERAAKTPKGQWIFGFKYDDTKIEEGRFLHKSDLNNAAPEHPVQIVHRGGHSSFVNDLALKIVGVTSDTPDPAGGQFVREDGELTGRVLETANYPFYKYRPEETWQTYVDGVKLISDKLAKAGITTVHDAGGSPEDLKAYQEGRANGVLNTRVYCLIRAGHIDKMISAGVRTGLGDDWVKVGPMKAGIDGSISERTARLSTPYIGSEDDYGILTSTRDQLYEVCKKAHDSGWQLGVHSNGDVGIDITLGVYEQLQKENPRRDPRFRLEHCTVVNPDLVRRIQALGAIPTPFSTYVYFHGEKMKYYGEERLNSMFALRSFLDAGIKVTQTSDYPPGPYEPMMALQSSVTRTDYTGKLWGPDQRITIEEALKIGTMHGAHASYDEGNRGSIQEGKLADLVVLSADPTSIDPFSLMDIAIERTMVGGRWVYES